MNKYQAVIIGFGKAGKTLAVTLAKPLEHLKNTIIH